MQRCEFSITDYAEAVTALPASGGIINPLRWLLAAVLGNQFASQGLEH